MRGYGITSFVLIGLYPLLPGRWGGIEVIVVFGGAAVCIGYGRRSVQPGRRRTWTLLLWSLVVFVVANVLLLSSNERAVLVGRLMDAAGYLLLLTAGLALIIRQGTRNLGGVIDAA